METEGKKERYMIREAAKQVGAETHVLRYWEKELSLEIPKNDMGHRYYTEKEVALLRQVKYLKDQGFHLKAIRLLREHISEVAQMDMEKLHSLKNRLNSQLAVEVQEKEIQEKGTLEAEEKKELEEEKEKQKKGGKEDKNHTVVFYGIKGAPAGVPAGKVVGTKVTPIFPEKTALLELESLEEEPAPQPEVDGRMEQFRMIMSDIIGQALRENNKELAKDVSGNVSEKVLKEMDFMMRSQQEEEEARYRKLDETIRSCQRSRQETAAAREEEKKKRGLFSLHRQEKN